MIGAATAVNMIVNTSIAIPHKTAVLAGIHSLKLNIYVAPPDAVGVQKEIFRQYDAKIAITIGSIPKVAPKLYITGVKAKTMATLLIN